MKKLLFIFLLSVCPTVCFSQTQYDLNMIALMDFDSTNKEMERLYESILNEYKLDTIFIQSLKKTQGIWIQLRDEEMNAKFPKTQIRGSSLPMCWNIYKAELTSERIKRLKVWIDGIDEGEICSGSVKLK